MEEIQCEQQQEPPPANCPPDKQYVQYLKIYINVSSNAFIPHFVLVTQVSLALSTWYRTLSGGQL